MNIKFTGKIIAAGQVQMGTSQNGTQWSSCEYTIEELNEQYPARAVISVYGSDMASPSNYKDVDNCTSEAQVKRLIAFNKLQNIAKYLNDGWKPDFKEGTYNWYIIKRRYGGYKAMFISSENDGIVYFKSQYLANEAIRLMGEDSLNDLFSTDW